MDMASGKPDVLCSLQIIGFWFTKKCEGKLCSRNFNTSLRLMENGPNLQSFLNAFVIWNIWWSVTGLTVESSEVVLIINICLENLLGLAGS